MPFGASAVRASTSAVLALAAALAACPSSAGQSQARRILEATGVTGGLIVHVGCGDGTLTAALHASDSYLVHGLDADAANVAAARKHIRSLGLYGKVTAERWTGKRLPYAEGLVNLVVADGDQKVAADEVMRVLCPRGVACIERDGKWTKTVKPWPKEIDEWPQWLHGADGNAVAMDRVVGPPRHMQWIDRPVWQRHHNTVPSVSAMVSARGRLFCIQDDAVAGIRGLPGKWSLVARDAFNGVVLWRRRVAGWGWREWSKTEVARFNQPLHIGKRLVAVGDRVLVTLGFNAPLTALDAATGREIMTYPETRFTSEVVVGGASLPRVLSSGAETPRPQRLYVAVNAKAQKPGAIATLGPVAKRVLAFDAAGGEVLWRSRPYVGVASKLDSLNRITHLTLIAGGGQLYLLDGAECVSLSARDGKELWRSPRPECDQAAKSHFGYNFPNLCTLVYHGGRVFAAQPGHVKRQAWNSPTRSVVRARDAATGRVLWSRECGTWGHYNATDVFVIGGLVWVHDPQAFDLLGLDPATGKTRKTISTDKALNQKHHHRCYRNKATERFVLTSRRGVEFIDLASGDNSIHPWTRGICRLGILPCNGLLYAPPHPCICYITAKLNGLYALAPARRFQVAGSGFRDGQSQPLERGPAYGKSPEPETRNPEPDAWPTYRHDAARSGSTQTAVPHDLKRRWATPLGGRLSSPTVAGGKVFVASVDDHTVHALDAKDGSRLWSYTAGGRVDTPPTIHRGLALFGAADGWVYCLRASDGELAWRLRAAPEARRVIAYGQLESAWPLHGSVLVADGVAWCAAGRSSFLDGGIHACALEPETGKVLRRQLIASREPVGRTTYDMPPDQLGALPDVLLADGKDVFMRHVRLGAEQGKPAATPGSTPRLRTDGGLLDDSWFNQSFWSFAGKSRCRYLVLDQRCVYGVSAFKGKARHSRSLFTPGRGYTLFASDLRGAPQWRMQVPLRIKAMALAGGKLFAAGVPDVVDPKDPWASFDGRKGAALWVISTETPGRKLAEHKLDAPPVFDGMAAAGGRLYLSTVDGKVLCMGKSN